jgi:tetratricopeptide (TPR) repeat protein
MLAITLLLPLLLLGAAEGALRLAGIGALEPLFVPVARAPGFLQPNPEAIRRFFPDPRDAPDVSIDTTWFPASKAPGTVRIFVQGESSAAGFPYGRWASPAALLQQRLQRMYPDRRIEVINTGMAAVTSYVLLDFADEIIAAQADAVVIYTGHNEYLGIGGVGSTLVAARSPMLARFVSRLRRLHLYRSLERGLGALDGGASPDRGDGTLMARVVADRSIAFGSPAYRRGVEQFRGNLERLLAKYAAAGVPVFIGTLASNERDQTPFAGGEARARFEQARDFESAGDHAAAREAYREARDLDELRFRAPGEFNEVIREAAAGTGATVVDVQAALASASRHGIVGAELMLEHVHPNVEGYFRLATAYVPALTRLLGPPAVTVDDTTARRELPVTEVDRLHGDYRLAVLKSDWPFVAERKPTTLPGATNRIEAIAQRWFTGQIDWLPAMQEALVAYQEQGNSAEAARVAVNLAEALVNGAEAQLTAGRLLLRNGEAARGEFYLHRAIALDDTRIEPLLSLAQAQFVQGRVRDSIVTLEAALARQPDDERAQYWLGEMRREAGNGAATPKVDE